MNSKKKRSLILRYLLYILGAVLFFCSLFVISVNLGLWGKIPSTDELANLKYQEASEIYSRDSVLIGKYFLYDRQPITKEEVPQHLADALVAIEDERFYEHSGVDYRSLFRVAFKTVLLRDKSAGGGSTISQQLAKNLYPREASGKLRLVATKLKEMIIARRLESVYPKGDLLLHYLNTVSFGDNTFGIESASQKFFGKNAKDLRIEESAVLVGMLKATYSYNPRVFPEKSKARRDLVLRSMVRNEYLAEAEADSIIEKSLVLNYKDYDHSTGIAPYFREELRKRLLRLKEIKNDDDGLSIYTSGLKIYTTLDYKMQLLAEKTMAAHMSKLQRQFEKSHGNSAPWIRDKGLINRAVKNSGPFKKLISQGLSESEAIDSLSTKKSMVLSSWEGDLSIQASTIDSLRHYMKFLNTGSLSLDPATGAVLTWIGGIDHKHFKYDHISQSKRQVGSTFKPIVYAAALESGISPCTYFSAQEIEYKNLEGWSPGNSSDEDETYLNYSMEQALSRSVNTVAVKVLEKTGIPTVISQAANMGITAELPEQPSLALGTGEIGLDELAGAYASFANDGRAVRPYLITKVTRANGEPLFEHQEADPEEQALSDATRKLMVEMMKTTVNEGTAARIRTTYGLRNDIAGKTGTTQNNKDAWFAAITPKLVHVSWVGLDQHEIGFKSTSLGQGASAALPLFATFMKELNRDPSFNHITRVRFEKPDQEILASLNCKPVKRDGFFKRLFKNPKKKRKKKFKKS
ncbi:transglycosylase domain-containing protein [Poritiphilus flavus]|uniref:Penicillin-binding protein n=1 Tax=Poritiphilus flavus TaxID=2697053 RepID=A0A6L9EAP2_9FLAO|nr:transglycosylase domain-containing protein [Poritiphilus flavus]NAS11835.1 penicillin-binding protein [Poritiphilus flavus]